MRAFVVLVLILSFLSIFAETLEDYYPLSVGDYWIQHSEISNGGNDPVTFTMEIEEIEQINGEDYVRKLNWLYWDDGSDEGIWYIWFRSAAEGIRLGAFGETPILSDATIFDPPILWFTDNMLTVGNTYEVVIPEMGGTFSYITNQIGVTVTVPAGTFTNCLEIALTITDSTGAITQESVFHYAYQVGEVKNSSWNQWYETIELELTEYEVNLSSPQNEIPVNNLFLTNYPNPFNPTTIISFSLTTENTENTELIIYNLKGKKVKDLSQNLHLTVTMSGVEGSVIWNGNDDNNKSVSSGIYFYKITSEKFQQTKKMILMK